MKHRGRFITLEGPEGSGKSTHAKALARFLKSRGKRVLLTREPGGPAASEAIREVLLHPRLTMAPLTELLLYEAARAEHVARWIRPALEKGTWVICDRYTDSTLAYQGARGLSRTLLKVLNAIAVQGVTPDQTLLLDIDPAEGLRRAKSARGKTYRGGDRIEREALAFHRRVRREFLQLAASDRQRIQVVHPGAIAETQATLRNLLLKKFRHEL